jgi:acetamidase/formamidase
MDRLPATPDHCFWGFLDPDLEPVLTVDDGTELTIEAVTHHAGDRQGAHHDGGRSVGRCRSTCARTPG